MGEFVSEEEKTRLAKLWNEGKSAGEIALRCEGRSRNSVIGIITRMRDRGDPRIVRGGLIVAEFSDAESLKLLAMRENDGMTFRKIGEVLGRPSGACSAHYGKILRDMRQAGML